MSKRPTPVAPATVADVAKLAGVGRMTVSRVINKNGYVGKATEQRVRQAIAMLGFRPNEIARSLRGGRSNTIGIIVPDLGDTFFAASANEAQKIAAAHGYLSLISSAGRDEAVEAEEIVLMTQRNISGLLIVPTRRGLAPLLDLYARGTPIVAFGRPIPEFPCDEVLTDNVNGAYVATQHLLDHGHKYVACLGRDANNKTVQDRISGYRQAMRDAKLPERVTTGIDSPESAIELVDTWCSVEHRPTAIFTLNNVATMNVLLALKELRVRVPEECAIIGFDDLEYWRMFACPVTAVRQTPGEIGKCAAQLLFARLESTIPGGPENQHIVLPVDLIVRNSCGCTGPERVIRIEPDAAKHRIAG